MDLHICIVPRYRISVLAASSFTKMSKALYKTYNRQYKSRYLLFKEKYVISTTYQISISWPILADRMLEIKNGTFFIFSLSVFFPLDFLKQNYQFLSIFYMNMVQLTPFTSTVGLLSAQTSLHSSSAAEKLYWLSSKTVILKMSNILNASIIASNWKSK